MPVWSLLMSFLVVVAGIPIGYRYATVGSFDPIQVILLRFLSCKRTSVFMAVVSVRSSGSHRYAGAVLGRARREDGWFGVACVYEHTTIRITAFFDYVLVGDLFRLLGYRSRIHGQVIVWFSILIFGMVSGRSFQRYCYL